MVCRVVLTQRFTCRDKVNVSSSIDEIGLFGTIIMETYPTRTGATEEMWIQVSARQNKPEKHHVEMFRQEMLGSL